MNHGPENKHVVPKHVLCMIKSITIIVDLSGLPNIFSLIYINLRYLC